MSMDYWHKKWICPYITYNEKLKVGCEGKCRQVFPDKRAAQDFLERYCSNPGTDQKGGYRDCSICQMLDDYYKRKYAQ